MKLLCSVTTVLVFCVIGFGQSADPISARNKPEKIITGAEQHAEYLPYLRGKRVGMLANQTAIVVTGIWWTFCCRRG